ncbi:hypothetical protein GCM10022251_10860 [Phytohabitans flavus]|uniref:Uncharacterized protein n=1 Tax=Phytohabitans flavus TaxID=1076124 RepID=A0A6F8XJZ7_9ACTN|nr:hypothetical protein [Phytohabitans flavus]BCB74111.1 hypothetical protein Pflav_005210 [Phytohabitans flavus]
MSAPDAVAHDALTGRRERPNSLRQQPAAYTSPIRRQRVQPRVNASFERRRIIALAALVCVAAGSAAGLTTGLVSCTPVDKSVAARPLSATEAQRLAGMRARNFEDGRVGVRASLGKPGAEIKLAGWIDWRRPLTYLAATAPAPGPDDGLLQAVPGIIATRPGRADAGLPPERPPAKDWRVRPSTATATHPAPIDSFVALLFAIASDKPADQSGAVADLLARSDSRWLGTDRIADKTVDVLLGPAVPPQLAPTLSPSTSPTTSATGPASPTPGPNSLAAMGGAVRYWLDGDGRLHRFEALLSKDFPVKVDLTREERPEIPAIDALGGRTTKPRPLTDDEAEALALMPQRNRAAGGGRITLTVPMLPAGMLLANGWLDWRYAVAYIGAYDMDKRDERVLMRATATGVTVRHDGFTAGKLPPLPPPEGDWETIPWAARGDAIGGLDLDLLVNEALAVSGTGEDDPEALRESAVWLRRDTLAGGPVNVYEIAKGAEVGGARGAALMRYWMDRTGVLRRLELRTRTGALAQLDITPEDVPMLSRP